MNAPPITLRHDVYSGPLKIRFPMIDVSKFQGAAVVLPVVVDWFDIPEHYWVQQAMQHAWWDELPPDTPHFFDPNMINVEMLRSRPASQEDH